MAVTEERAVVTIDADFGAPVFRDGAKHVGVLRLREAKPAALAERASQLVRLSVALLKGAFVADDGDGARVTLPAKPQGARSYPKLSIT